MVVAKWHVAWHAGMIIEKNRYYQFLKHLLALKTWLSMQHVHAHSSVTPQRTGTRLLGGRQCQLNATQALSISNNHPTPQSKGAL